MHNTFVNKLELTKQFNIYLYIKSLNKEQTNIISTYKKTHKIITKINHPNFQTIIDVYSNSTKKIPITQLLHNSNKHLYHIHINDTNKHNPNFNTTDFINVLKTLKELNYQHYVSIKIFDFTPNPKTITTKNLHYLKNITTTL